MIREKIILDYSKDKNVLDIGSVGQTDAYNLWELYKSVNLASLTGIDLPGITEKSEVVFNVKNLNDDSKIVYGNMEEYQFERTFDVVVAGDVIEHVYNQGLFLNNIHKHLNDEGKLIITTPNAKWPTVILKPNPTHTLWHDRFTLEYILKEHGFKIDKFLYYYGNKKNYNLVARLLTMRQSICVICSKA